MDKDTTKSTFDKVFESFSYEDFCNIVAASTVDKYVKKLNMTKLLYLLVVAQIAQTESLKALADTITQDENLQKALHLTSVSASALSRRIRNIHHDIWAQIFSNVSRNTNLALTGSIIGFAVSGIGVGAVFGGFMSTMPAIISERYGLKNFGVNYGITFIGFSLAAIFGPMTALRSGNLLAPMSRHFGLR
jgi:MFS family permease